MEDVIIRALARNLLRKFPQLKGHITEAELRKFLTAAWRPVRSRAEANQKTIVTTAVNFRRSVSSVIQRLARQDDAALKVTGMVVSGGLHLLAARPATKAQVVNDIVMDATRRMA